jgi:hypothetical protein
MLIVDHTKSKSRGNHGKSGPHLVVRHVGDRKVLYIGPVVVHWLKTVNSPFELALKVYIFLLKCYIRSFKAKYYITPREETPLERMFKLSEMCSFRTVLKHCEICFSKKGGKRKTYWEHDVGYKVTDTRHSERIPAYEAFLKFVDKEKDHFRPISNHLQKWYGDRPKEFIQLVRDLMRKHGLFLKDGCDKYVQLFFDEYVDFKTFLYILYPYVRFCKRAMKVVQLIKKQNNQLLGPIFHDHNRVSTYINILLKFIKVMVKSDTEAQVRLAEAPTDRERILVAALLMEHLEKLRSMIDRCEEGFPVGFGNLDIHCELISCQHTPLNLDLLV